jgi:leucyl-tRNA synthetase
MRRYNPKEIEPKWQKVWAESDLHKAVDFSDLPKFVMLTEFPYPSGVGLHLGHVREYTYGDIIAREKRMQGYNVLYPMGYDAFGLPTENYAIKNKISPQFATQQNVSNFQKELERLGYSIDWDRSFRTSDPDYYKWTQWLFLQFYKAGLAYQDEIAINWCPFCKTGLSNEEVVNGRHERCDTVVEKKVLKQWLLKITDYADRLIDGLRSVDYPRPIAEQQINWIGRSSGAEIAFEVVGLDVPIKVFTTRPDTIFGSTFLVLAPEHPLVEKVTKPEHKDHVKSYIKMAHAKTDIERQEESREKTGATTGAHAINPATGLEIPIWVADYVLPNYGTGAIMAVPAHDERDNEFAHKHKLPIVSVIKPEKAGKDVEIYTGEGTMANSGKYNGQLSIEAKEKIVSDLAAKGLAKEKINYRLRDWIFSRQHYWGEPIPIIHCPDHGAVAVPDNQLPVELPPVDHYEPTETGESPLAQISDWVNVPCPICGKPAKRETDTMPNWAGSSWYYLRYFDPHNDETFAGRDKLDYWREVDMYLGGMEHTTLHLLYSRFWHQFLYDQGLVPTPEPYAARRGQGIILAADGTKMSKSKGNVVTPSEIIESGYGADALRMGIAFLAPYDQTTPWSPEAVTGAFRFLQRVWVLTDNFLESSPQPESHIEEVELTAHAHRAIKKVTQDLEKLDFNTAIAALMSLVNELYKIKAEKGIHHSPGWQFALEVLQQLLAPFAPHIAEELWQALGHEESVHISRWPQWDEELVRQEMVTLAVQVNGKVRAEILVEASISEQSAIEAAKSDEKIAQLLAGKKIKRAIYVPGRLVSLVVSD